MHSASDSTTKRYQISLIVVVTFAGALLAGYALEHAANAIQMFSLAVLIAACGFDAISGSIPLLLLLFAVAAAIATAVVDHRIPWLAVGTLPLAYTAWRSSEDNIGWGDVLALLVLVVALPFWTAATAVLIGVGCSLAATLLRRESAGRMTPYLALGAAAALWLWR